MIESLWEDSRYAIRNLRRDPFLALAATLTLAVCIGANTTVFSVANSILIRPLPYPQLRANRLDQREVRARATGSWRGAGLLRSPRTEPDFRRCRRFQPVYSELDGNREARATGCRRVFRHRSSA